MAYHSDNSYIYKYKNEKKLFFQRNYVFKKFKYVTEERKDEIKENAIVWNKKQFYGNSIARLLAVFLYLKALNINNMMGKKTDFNYSTSDEELLFYLFSIDPELKLLQIYYDENNIKDIKRRFIEEFGLEFDSRLLKIELVYNEKFPTIIDEFEVNPIRRSLNAKQ